MAIVIKTMLGLGDCIYLRPILKQLPVTNIVLSTSWPQAFHDLKGLRFTMPEAGLLHSQKDNVRTLKASGFKSFGDVAPHYTLDYNTKINSATWFYAKILLGYQPKTLDNTMECSSECIEEALIYIKEKVISNKPICLIRPNTQRPEWFCWARSPKDEYLQLFIDTYKHKYTFISIANIKPGIEEYERKLSGCDLYIEKPTYNLTVGLFKLADLIVCTPSFWLALAAAFDKKTICLFGASDKPFNVIDKRLVKNSLTIVAPNPFDVCHIRKVGAFKDIPREVLLKEFEHVTRS